MKLFKTFLTILVPAVVYCSIPTLWISATGRSPMTWNMAFLWAASGLVSAAAVTVLCRRTPRRTWFRTAMIVAAAVVLLPACFVLAVMAEEVTHFGPMLWRHGPPTFLTLLLHMALVAPAAILYWLPRRTLAALFAAAVLMAVGIHTWEYDLLAAAAEGDIARVRLVLWVFPTHPHKYRALCAAAANARKDLAHFLLERGIDPNGTPPVLPTAAVDHFGSSDAERKARSAIQKDLIAHGADVNARDAAGCTALFRDAFDNPDAAEFLIERGADVNARDSAGRTPLIDVADIRLDAVRLLVEHGADVNARDNRGLTCIHEATGGSLETVEFLVAHGADLRAKDNRGRTALHYLAAGYERQGMLDYLLTHGLDVNAGDSSGMTALHVAVGRELDDGTQDPPSRAVGNEEMVRRLLEKGARIDARDAAGRTALHYYALYNSGWEEVLKALLQGKPDLNARDNDGRTPLGLARQVSNEDAARLLELAGAK
jgi:ankyrin repeat protein